MINTKFRDQRIYVTFEPHWITQVLAWKVEWQFSPKIQINIKGLRHFKLGTVLYNIRSPNFQG